jgi:N,N'-diacetyllegionaminate synthase
MEAYIIAEAGACGDGDYHHMIEQIGVAQRAGCDAVKFQWTSNADAMAARRGAAKRDGYDDIYRKYLQWPASWHNDFEHECERHGLDYLCTVYLPADISTVARHVRHFKVSSFESADVEFLRAHQPFMYDRSRRLLISTGMCDSEEITQIRVACYPTHFNDLWLHDGQAVLMHCTSAYPTPFDAMELRAIQAQRLDGYSDHTVPELTGTGALAVAAGANWIEAHMRLPGTDTRNPDRDHAMTEDQLTQYVASIRMAEAALGSGLKVRQSAEDEMIQYKVMASI